MYNSSTNTEIAMFRNQVQQLIDSHPRHFSRMIQSNPVLREWVISNTSLDSDNFSEKVYSAISGETIVTGKQIGRAHV